jgi:hypothetical protein
MTLVFLSTQAFTTDVLKTPAAVATPPTIVTPRTNPANTFDGVLIIEFLMAVS